MNSNIKIQKICEFCGQEFTARTLYTRYCSKPCNKKHYKQLLLEKNLEIKDSQENIKVSPLETLRNASQEYFEVNGSLYHANQQTDFIPTDITQKNQKEKNAFHDRDPER